MHGMHLPPPAYEGGGEGERLKVLEGYLPGQVRNCYFGSGGECVFRMGNFLEQAGRSYIKSIIPV